MIYVPVETIIPHRRFLCKPDLDGETLENMELLWVRIEFHDRGIKAQRVIIHWTFFFTLQLRVYRRVD